jgi:hypothetical protein
LDSDTGVIILTKELDYETTTKYTFTIEAKDCGDTMYGSKPAYSQIEIIINDVNDNPPEISVSFPANSESNNNDQFYRNQTQMTGLYNIFIKENQKSDKFIAHVSIIDRDTEEESRRVYWSVSIDDMIVDSSHSLPHRTQDSELDSKLSKLLSVRKLNDNSFILSTGTSQMDRETTPSLNVTIASWNIEKNKKINWSF